MTQKSKKVKRELPDIQDWYNHGTGVDVIRDRLVREFGYTPEDAGQIIEEIIYG